MSSAWFALIGMAGGALNALLSDNWRARPTRIRIAGRVAIARPGLLVNIAAGGGAAGILCWALDLPSNVVDARSLEATALASAFIGLMTARLITNEADKRALRAAACLACLAPAADSDTVRAIEIAQPFAAYVLAGDLIPKHAAPRRVHAASITSDPRR